MLMIAVTVLHIFACLFLILVVLLQTGKGAEMGAVFGGGGSQTIFGASGAGNLLTKLTTGIAIIFFITSLTLAWSSLSKTRQTVFDEPLPEPPPAGAPADAKPSEPGAATAPSDADAPPAASDSEASRSSDAPPPPAASAAEESEASDAPPPPAAAPDEKAASSAAGQ